MEVTLPTGYKKWFEVYRRAVHDLTRHGIKFNDDTELKWERRSLEYGIEITFNELDPGTTVRDLKSRAFDELYSALPSRRQMFDALHGPPSGESVDALRPLMDVLATRDRLEAAIRA